MFKLTIAFALLVFIGSVFAEKRSVADEMQPIPFTKSMQEEILQYHNKVRGSATPPASNMEKMYWDDKMAEMALKHAEKCVFTHDSAVARQFDGYLNVGQNLFEGGAKPSVIDVASSWYAEKKYFTFGQSTKEIVGHYTQVMQDKAARVGCGGASCGNNSYIVACNYLRGQYDFLKPYKLGETCAACPNNCKDNLCDCKGKVCKNDGVLNLDTCKCQCPINRLGELCDKTDCKKVDPFYCVYYKLRCPVKFGFYIRNLCPHTCGLC